MKNIPLSPILALFVLVSLFSCTKDPQKPIAKDADLGHVLNMIQDKEGILHLTVSAAPSQGDAVRDRDGCTMYEAMRFTELSSDLPDRTQRCSVYVSFRLVKINKNTSARTALTNYITVNTGSGVGGLNISWYDYSPLSDYWYAAEFNYCYRPGILTQTEFAISDFWGDDYLVQTDPWDCDNRRAANFEIGPVGSTWSNADLVVVRCSLNEDCTISPVPNEDPCSF
ncbi:MAG: hypothetical protein KF734_17315 [Saprospiraceae bacterium]|nr:hypothetical protein [Saprospiraceae bacterium]